MTQSEYERIVRIIKDNSETMEAYSPEGELDTWEAVNTTILLSAIEGLYNE